MGTATMRRATLRHLLDAAIAFQEGRPPPAGGAIDWKLLLRLAEFHRLVPILHRQIASTPPVPEEALAAWRARGRGLAGRAMDLTAELLRVSGALEREGVRAMPLKGPPLARFLYGDVTVRTSGDVDILVRPEDFATAARILEAVGYEPLHRLPPRWEREVRRFEHHLGFKSLRSPAGRGVELHWALFDKGPRLRFDLDGIWERSLRVPFAGTTILTMPPEDLFLYLSVHGSKHAYFRLQWLADVAQLLRRHPDLDWEVVQERATQANARPLLLLTLLTAHSLLAAPVPEPLLRLAREHRRVAEAARRIETKLFGDADEPLVPRLWKGPFHQLMAGESVPERAAYWASWGERTLLKPQVADWKALPLPEALYPLYYAVRPARLAVKYGRGGLLRAISRLRPRGTTDKSGPSAP